MNYHPVGAMFQHGSKIDQSKGGEIIKGFHEKGRKYKGYFESCIHEILNHGDGLTGIKIKYSG